VPSAVEVQFLQTSGSHSLPALRQGQRSVRHCVLQLQPRKLQQAVHTDKMSSEPNCLTVQWHTPKGALKEH
jgi:hypothetical protein